MNKIPKRKVFQSTDGSKTLYWDKFDEHYHSVHGAYNESMHVFIKEGLEKQKNLETIHIFEMGFGTGLNALLTYQYAKEHNINIKYTAIELYPISLQELEELTIEQIVSVPKELVEDFHRTPWNSSKQFDDFELIKVQNDLTKYNFTKQFDLIYYDAFGPRAQPELWTKEIFRKLFNAMNQGGILVTYCAKGQVKRDLKSVGFKVEAIPGPPRKREMTRAIKL